MTGAAGAGAGARSHLPGRAVANHLRLAEFRQRFVVHAAEIIIRRIVFADVLHAEAEILAFAVAPLGRAKHALVGAAGEFATRRRSRRRRLGGAARLDANAVEQA
jgi:hypothetical protein